MRIQNQERKCNREDSCCKELKKIDSMLMIQLNTREKCEKLSGYIVNDGIEFVQKKEMFLHIECIC